MLETKKYVADFDTSSGGAVAPETRLRPWLFGLFALCAGGCDDALKPTEIVQEPRVLGARVEVEGEPQRAAPFPGERARVRFLVAAPELEASLGYALIACRATLTNAGLGSCREPAFADSVRVAPEALAPELEFVLPEAEQEEERPRLLVSGVLCANGSPIVSEMPSACESGTDELRVNLEVDLATERDQNQNPSFEAAQVLLDGESFEAAAELTAACQGSGVREVPSGSEHRIRVEFPESARDRLERESSAGADRESLLLSHFASSGELERAFSPVTPETPEIAADVSFRAPAVSDPGGQLVRFWFVVRDLRGGSDFAERALCVVP